MRRKPKIITHAVLIFLIAVILFPVVWVVMTSLRRDNAAFSPKLFSTNLTLQHYKDLLFPPRNVPVLISELGNAISMSKPFDEWKIDEVKDRIKDDIEKLHRYIGKAREISKLLAKYLSNFEEELHSSWQRLWKGVKEGVEDFTGSLPRENFSGVSAMYVYEIMGKKGGWYEPSVEDEREYERVIGWALKSKEEIEKEVSNAEEELGKVDSKLSDLSDEIFKQLKVLKSLGEDIGRVARAIKRGLQIPGSETVAVDQKRLLEISGRLKTFEELKDIATVLESLASSITAARVSPDVVSVIDEYVQELMELVDDVSFQLSLLEKMKDEMDELERRRRELEEEKISLKSKLESVESEIERFLNDHKKEIGAAYSAYLSWKIRGILEFPNAVKEWNESIMDDLAKLYGRKVFIKVKKCIRKVKRAPASEKNMVKKRCTEDILGEIDGVEVIQNLAQSIRKEIPDIERMGLSSTEARKLLSLTEWAESYSKFREAAAELWPMLEEIVEKMERSLRELESKWQAMVEMAALGRGTIPHEVFEMSEILSTSFDAKISGKLGIAMREARSLADTFPLKERRKDFRKIDATLYSLLQDWKRKPKHYFLRWVMNSIIVSGLVAIITTAVTALAAYPFSRMRFFGRRYGIMTLLLIQMFPAIMYMVALYGMLAFLGKLIPWLGLDTLGGLIFVYLGGIAFNMFLIKGFYDTIPSSLEESAMIDGATRFQTFWLIIVPLARPILAVVIILTFMGTFNEFVLARIILQDVKNYTYALGLWQFTVGPFETEWGLFTAAALLGMLPMVVLFLSMQRFLISGLTKGSVKG